MELLIGVPIAACMIIPLVAASIGVETKHRIFLWALLFLGLIVLDLALLYLPVQTGFGSALHLRWNWFGKLFALAWAVPFIALGPITFGDAGVRKPLPDSTVRAITVVVILAAVAFFVHWLLRTGAPRSAETILYQLSMPAIAEEVVFRGVLFAVLVKAFREPENQHWWKSRTVWLTAIAFAMMHGWSAVNGAFQFSAMACILPFVFGVIAGALRKYSGSLAFPILLHSAVNVAAAIFP